MDKFCALPGIAWRSQSRHTAVFMEAADGNALRSSPKAN